VGAAVGSSTDRVRTFLSALWARMPLHKRLLPLIWPFLSIVVLLVLFAVLVTDVLSAARAFVEGESRWSKAQKESVFHLLEYAETYSEESYRDYLRNIAVPKKLGEARVEMEKDRPDYARAWQLLLEGGDHPDDIDGVIRLYRNFRHLWYIAEIVRVWEVGDQHIAALDATAHKLHTSIQSGDRDPARIKDLVHEILGINARLTPFEVSFSNTLGEANRITKVIFIALTLTIAATLVPLGAYLSQRMLKRGQAAELALKLSEERFQLAVSGSNDGLWDWNLAADEWYFSPRLFQLLGYEFGEVTGSWSVFMDHVHEEDRELIKNALRSHLQQGTAYDVEIRLRTKHGGYRWFRTRGQSVRDAGGIAIRMAGAITDITEKQIAAAELFAEKERAQVTLASIGDGVITADTDGWVEYLNPVAEDLTGWKMSDAKGLPLQAMFRLVDEATRRPVANPIELVLNQERTIEASTNILLVRKDSVDIPVVLSAAPIRDRAGTIVGVVLVLHDVSRERQYAAKLSYQASHDALTGLINRTEFERRLELALQSAAEQDRHHAVMYMDLDQFKVVNDTCGHAAGDQLMRQVATLLQHCLREGDTLARIGGDEFGVLLENCQPEAASRIAEKLRQTLTDFQFAWANLSFNIGVSIGLVDIQRGLFTLAEVLRQADTACYIAKEKGRNRVQVYHADDSELTSRQGEMEWVGRLQKAIDQNRFVLYAQDIKPLRGPGGAGVHCELLIRMVDESGRLVPPMAFIPAAERYNLMPAIDRWVLRTALATLSRIGADHTREQVDLCAINISGASIGDERFLKFVREQLDYFAVPHHSICFEITETVAIANLDKAVYFIRELKELGCRFSLDDFGAGMSSFAYLKHLPVDFLKIDGGFVKDMANDPIDRAMVEAINSVGHVMGKQTIAEFVDSKKVMAVLREIGVDYAQGYGVAQLRPFEPTLQVQLPPLKDLRIVSR
jgi:diguanylate cyclase (GGDEF)-like protein/PAS domain S-box-containing protein